MKVYNNEIKCQRGETFQLNRTFLNEDGTPFVIPSELHNPHFLITVASVSQMTENRYLRNFWLEIVKSDSSDDRTINEFLSEGGVPVFDRTRVVDLSTSYTSWSTVPIYSNFSANVDGNTEMFYIQDILDDNSDWYGPYYRECVFVNKKSPTDSTLVYKYFVKKKREIDNDGTLETEYYGEYDEYSMDFSFPFTRDVTEEWISQKYLYGISLVAGLSTHEEVEKFCVDNSMNYNDVKQLYGIGEDGIMEIIKEGDVEIKEFRDSLVSYNSNLYHCFAEGIPLSDFDFVQVLLNPTALYVSTDLKGGMLNG